MRLPNKFRLAKSPETSAEEQKVHPDITPQASYREEWNLCVQIMVWDQYWACVLVCGCSNMLLLGKQQPCAKKAHYKWR